MNYLINALHIFGIVLLRFRLLPRLWALWLVLANTACLFFIEHAEAQVVLAATLTSVILQAILYGNMGFTRLLGVVHLLWLPMFAWIATRIEIIQAEPDLARWLVVLAITNGVSLVIDAVDVTRYTLGERTPHYVWKAP